MDHLFVYITLAVAATVLILLLFNQKVSILNPANPLAILFFIISLAINGVVLCEEWVRTRSLMIIAKFRRTKFRTFSSPSIIEEQFKVTY